VKKAAVKAGRNPEEIIPAYNLRINFGSSRVEAEKFFASEARPSIATYNNMVSLVMSNQCQTQ